VDRGTKKLSKDVLAACKVRAKRFPSVVQPGSKPAKLTEAVAEATGLGRVPVVAVAGHDLASAAATLPVSGEGAAFLRTGAVSVLGVETASPMVNDQTFEMGFSNEAGAGGVNLLVKRIPGTDLLDRCLAAWRAAGRDYGPEDLARMAREGAPVAAQLDPEDPALRSAFASPSLNPADAINRYCTLRSMSSPPDDSAIVRLIYSSLAEKTGDTFTKLQSITPFRLKSLYITGEWALDPVLCQMVADECAVPVTAGPVDAAVLGNVRIQAGLTREALSASFPSVTYTPAL
jgi:rhamnulokinase